MVNIREGHDRQKFVCSQKKHQRFSLIALWGALVTAAVTCAFISASCSGELSKDEAKEIIETSSHIICPSLVQVLLYADAPKQITAGGDTQVAYESSMQAAKLLHKAGLLTMRETGENGNTHYTLELSHKLERFIASKNENKLYVKLFLLESLEHLNLILVCLKIL